MNEIQKELEIVKEQAWKGFEKSRDANQMEAAAMFLAQIERLLTHKMGIDTLMEQLSKTDEMPDYGTQFTPTGTSPKYVPEAEVEDLETK